MPEIETFGPGEVMAQLNSKALPEGAVSREAYCAARDALQALVEEWERLFRQGVGLEGLRAWLDAGVATRWVELEAVVHQARAAVALSMVFEHEWRREHRKRQRKEQRQRKREAKRQARAQAAAAAPAQAPAPRKTPEGPSAAKAAGVARRYEPGGRVWTP